MDINIEKYMQELEQQNIPMEVDKEVANNTNDINDTTVENPQMPLVEQLSKNNALSVDRVVGNVQQKVLGLANEKINSDEILAKHADNIAKITDRAMEVDAERVSLTVEQQDTDNKVTKQEIKNRLIVLKAEAIRLEKEQKQLNKEQKADYKARNKQAKWELYKGKLEKMHYTYVPNIFILSMLLFFDGVRSFFDGLGTVSTAIVKAFKWVIFIGLILVVLFAVPVTREWLLNLLNGNK